MVYPDGMTLRDVTLSLSISVATMARNRYVARGRNELHTIFERHFADFCERYNAKYTATYGRYRLERIQRIGKWFCSCGDYLPGSRAHPLYQPGMWSRLLPPLVMQEVLSVPFLESQTMVSIGDVVRAVIHDTDILVDQLEHYISGSL